MFGKCTRNGTFSTSRKRHANCASVCACNVCATNSTCIYTNIVRLLSFPLSTWGMSLFMCRREKNISKLIALGLNSMNASTPPTQAHAINPCSLAIRICANESIRMCARVVVFVCERVFVRLAFAGEYLFDDFGNYSFSRWLFFHGVATAVSCSIGAYSKNIIFFPFFYAQHRFENILRFWKITKKKRRKYAKNSYSILSEVNVIRRIRKGYCNWKVIPLWEDLRFQVINSKISITSRVGADEITTDKLIETQKTISKNDCKHNIDDAIVPKRCDHFEAKRCL